MNTSDDFSPAFQKFGATVAAAAIQQQDLFNATLGPSNRWADLEARTLTGPDGVLDGVSLLGSFSHVTGTWLWGWANPSFEQTDRAIAPTLRIREFGTQYGIIEFTTGEPDLSKFPAPHQAATTLAIAAGVVLGGHGTWSTAINDGQGAVYLHVDDSKLPTAGFDPIATPRLLLAAVGAFPADHRRVVRGYFKHFNIQYADTPDAISGQGPDGSTITATFDSRGRLERTTVEPGSPAAD
ncbi:hypothetical protein EV138_6500 [Kribbella voronezhensis]|uniref:Uncharacterized protein n=1 Tax=Kribbella voronezhensis TaxID=2512212 RepID=A0A4R7SXM5_9ACTN|nr:DUF6882 domain-containing protein [Kribbella voronezhensis]TDU84031.1 hypothetical protein EV138_6500 [Kribbella voronezhensis]